MANIATATFDGSTSFSFFPDPHTLLTPLNNDVTLSTLPNDKSYTTDDVDDEEDDDNDESTVPSSYLTIFPVKAARLSSGCKDDSTASSSTYRRSPSENEIYNTNPFGNTPFQPSTPTIRCSSMESGSSSSSTSSERRKECYSNVPYSRPFSALKPEMRINSTGMAMNASKAHRQ